MAQQALESWRPEPSHVHIPPHCSGILTSLVVVLMMASVLGSSMLRSVALLVLPLWLLWVVARSASSRAARSILIDGVLFELTSRSVRVRLGDASRDVSLADIEAVDVVATSSAADVGHVVFRRSTDHGSPPAIPTGRRVSGGTIGLVTWANVEDVDPAEQLFEGALTFWFVARPYAIRHRIEAAREGLSPYSMGPHR